MNRLTIVFAMAGLGLVQGQVDEATTGRIRREVMEHSEIMRTLHMLTDRYGPRVTGTPNHEAAAKWVVWQLTQWGLKNGHLEPWDFGHAGWLNERASGFITAPVKANLKFEVLAWTPSTDGTATGPAIQLAPPLGPEVLRTSSPAAGTSGALGDGVPERLGPTGWEMEQWVSANQGKVRGKIVLIGKAAVIPVDFSSPQKRRPDDQVKAQYAPPNPDRVGGLGISGGAREDSGWGFAINPNRLTAQQVSDKVDAMLLDGGALVRVNDAARGEGIIVAQQHPAYDVTREVPTVILRNDDYGRIERLLDDGEDVRLEFTVLNHTYPEGKTSYNALAEIPGTDKAGEVVMLGGHLDSWHAATGATDNAIGASVMMEAARLIQALGLKPRRTIRIALWSGEEQGLLGSLAYVKRHFGTAEDPQPEWATLDCYFNVDAGTGRLRGASVFGPPEAAAALRPVLAQFADWGLYGALPASSRAPGGTDSTSFNHAGLPGIAMAQDPIEYHSLSHHTSLDTYARIIPDDVRKAAAEIAAAVWYVANRDQPIPRFTKETMPAPVAAR